jgi:hypothetical protein
MPWPLGHDIPPDHSWLLLNLQDDCIRLTRRLHMSSTTGRGLNMSLTSGSLFSMPSRYKKLWLNCHLRLGLFHTTCASSFPALRPQSRVQSNFWRRLQDAVCQLVGFGLVPRYVVYPGTRRGQDRFHLSTKVACGRAAAPCSGSARVCKVCPVQHPACSASSIASRKMWAKY